MTEPLTPTGHRAFKFRAVLTRDQERKAGEWLKLTRDLYNAALQERRDAYRKKKETRSAYTQQKDLKTIRVDLPEYQKLPTRLLQEPLQRLDLAFQSFFRRVKSGQTPGYPRFRSAKRWDSLVWADPVGCRLESSKVVLSKFGGIKIIQWTDPSDGSRLLRVALKREADGWYVVLTYEIPKPKSLPSTGKTVGIDLGLKSLVAFSDGTLIPHPKWSRKANRKIVQQQRRVSRRIKGSNRRRKAVHAFAKTHQHVARKRKYFLDCLSRKLVNENDVIAVEKLNVRGISRGMGSNSQGRGFRRSVLDASWGQLIWMLSYKAESAGRKFVQVDPAYSSQTCPSCGTIKRKELSERVHSCDCGYVADRDVAAAQVILQRALEVLRCPIFPLNREGRAGMGSSVPLSRESCLGTGTYGS